jgi:hypothetical protein
MRLFQCCALAVVVLSPALVLAQPGMPSDQEMERSNKAYRVGTDVAMMYLARHAGRLRVTLLLQECNMPDLASAIGVSLPNSVASQIFRMTPTPLLRRFRALICWVLKPQ